MSRWATVLACFLILLAAAGVTAMIFFTEPKAVQGGATKQTAMLVEVAEVKRGSYRPTISVMGVVEPAEEIMLSPRVSGEIVERSPSFTPGGVVEKGDVLLRLDPSDYEAELMQRRSELRQAQAELSLEMGRQNVAKQDYEFLEESLVAERRALVLREPQLNSAMASVESAEAALRMAELNLERTTIRAPFDAQIVSREANVGSQVSPGDPLGRLVGRDVYWVSTAIPLSKLRWISFEEGEDGKGARVQVRNRAAWPEGVYREGTVHRLVGTLETETRMARVLIEVPDPLGQGAVDEEAGRPALMIGAFVEALIEAKEIKDVVRLERDHVRQGDTVWVMEERKLRIRDLDIVFEDGRYAYVSSGLEDGDWVVTTNLSTPVDGEPLRLEGMLTEGTEAGQNATGE